MLCYLSQEAHLVYRHVPKNTFLHPYFVVLCKKSSILRWQEHDPIAFSQLQVSQVLETKPHTQELWLCLWHHFLHSYMHALGIWTEAWVGNTWKWKSGKKWGRPGRIHHLSDIGWVGQTTSNFKHGRAELSAAVSRVSSSGEALKRRRLNDKLIEDRLISTTGPDVHLASTWCHSHDGFSQSFPVFCCISALVYYMYCQCKPKNEKWEGLRMRLNDPYNTKWQPHSW